MAYGNEVTVVAVGGLKLCLIGVKGEELEIRVQKWWPKWSVTVNQPRSLEQRKRVGWQAGSLCRPVTSNVVIPAL